MDAGCGAECPINCEVWHARTCGPRCAGALDLGAHVVLLLPPPKRMSLTDQVLSVLDEVLSLNGRSATFGPETHLRGAVPELDSMAVVSLISALEDHFGFTINEDEISSDTFATVGALVSFVGRQTKT